MLVKLICENIPNLDIVDAGKIPTSSGLINQSEVSLTEYESSRAKRSSFGQQESFQVESPRKRSYRVRSLILFWAIDKSNYEILRFLWTFDKFRDINWGIKNLEFMLLLANDIQDYQILDILLEPKPFAIIMKSLVFTQAMDFIEDHIINNSVIPEELKLKLLNSQEMISYSFVGAFLHYSDIIDEIEDGDELEQEIGFRDVMTLYNKMTKEDIERIRDCQ